MSAPPDGQADEIEEIAAEWLVQRDEGLTAAQAREFEAWRRADPRHAAAVARLERAAALMARMPGVRDALQPPVVPFPRAARVTPTSIPPRHRLGPGWIAGGLVAAAALAAAVWWPRASAPEAARSLATSAGGFERAVLDDGSVVELNGSTRLRVDFAPGERRVALLAGEAHFTVAPDAARPFVVAAGAVAVRAVGTAFNVRLGAESVEVLVTEGKVALARPAAANAPAAPPTLLAASERVIVPNAEPRAGPALAQPVVEKIAPEVVRAALAWQERRLVFAETPLREVVAQFNRRNRLQLTVTDPALAGRPIGGTFAADNAEGFVRLLESGGAVVVERRGEFELLLHPAR
ncbi:MAG: FecR domain-containing protein [Verrucomicrobia bacterium]|nr:FecR domain-containing protein [Verrucomicrobiota bacterium]